MDMSHEPAAFREISIWRDRLQHLPITHLNMLKRWQSVLQKNLRPRT